MAKKVLKQDKAWERGMKRLNDIADLNNKRNSISTSSEVKTKHASTKGVTRPEERHFVSWESAMERYHSRDMQSDRHRHEMGKKRLDHSRDMEKIRNNDKTNALIAAGILTYRDGRLTAGPNAGKFHEYDTWNMRYVPVEKPLEKPQKTYEPKPRKKFSVRRAFHKVKEFFTLW